MIPSAALQIALLATKLGTVDHLNRPSTDPPLHHPLPHLRQSRRRLNLAPILAAGILPSRPQHFARCAPSRPDHRVQIHRIRLLGPDVHLAAQHQGCLLGREMCCRIVGVDETPILQWGTVVVEGVEFLEGLPIVKVEPLAAATVEVLQMLARQREPRG